MLRRLDDRIETCIFITLFTMLDFIIIYYYYYFIIEKIGPRPRTAVCEAVEIIHACVLRARIPHSAKVCEF